MLDRPSASTSTWTEERIKTMRKMLAHGHSYGEIAAALSVYCPTHHRKAYVTL